MRTNLFKIFPTFLLACLLISSYSAFAQKMEWSNTRKLKGSAVFTGVIGENDDGIYLLRFRNKFLSKNVIIERYRHQLGLMTTKNILLKKSRLLHAELTNNGILLITTHFNRKTMLNEVQSQFFDADINAKGDAVTHFTSELVDYYDKGDFRVKMSNDRSKILIYHTEKTRANRRSLHLNVFTTSMQLIHSKHLEIRIDYEEFMLTNSIIDNEGNAFFLVGQRQVVARRGITVPGSWSIFHYKAKSDSMFDYAVLDSGLQIIGSYFSWDRFQNKINLTAFYLKQRDPNIEVSENSDLFDENGIKGLYNFEFWIDGNHPPKSNYVKFTPNFVEDLLGDKLGLGSDGIKNFKIIETIPNSDGGITLIAERSSFLMEQDITYVNGLPQTMSRNMYNFDDVLVLSLDSEYDVKWKHVINKSQSSLNDGGYYSSITIANTRSNLYILYNDRLRTNGDVIQYAFSPEGEVSNKILIRSDANYVSIIPSEAKQIGYNTLLLPVSKDNKFSMLKLVYPN